MGRLRIEQISNLLVSAHLFVLLRLQRLSQDLARAIAFPHLVSQLQNLVLLCLTLQNLAPLLLEIGREFVEHSLQKLAAEQSFSSPSSGEHYLSQRKSI